MTKLTWVLAFGLLSGCRTSERVEDGQAVRGSTVTAPAPALPADHLAAGELLEGSEKAFGLTLPRGLQIEEAFTKVTYASGRLEVRPVVEYLRARLQDGESEEGKASATFRRVHVRAQPSPELDIHVGTAVQGVRVEIRDVTTPPAPALPDETARWRNVGMTPQGALVNANHLD